MSACEGAVVVGPLLHMETGLLYGEGPGRLIREELVLWGLDKQGGFGGLMSHYQDYKTDW